jgi:hypothetical protein
VDKRAIAGATDTFFIFATVAALGNKLDPGDRRPEDT